MLRAGSRALSWEAFAAPLNMSANLAPIWLVCGVLRADLTNHPINGELRVEPGYGQLDHLSLLEGFCE